MLTPERLERFTSVASRLKRHVMIVVTQMDPDAMGAAVALMEILVGMNAHFSIQIGYCGEIGHPQNRAIFNKLRLGSCMMSLNQIESLGDMDVLLVDSSSSSESRIPANLRPIDSKIVIDHHSGTVAETDGTFVEIDTGVGAASTLVVELADGLKAPLSERACLLLALGIHSDTKSLVGRSDRDFAAYERITRNVKPEAFAALIKYPLPPSFFDHMRDALTTMHINGSRIVACAGYLKPEEGDDVAAIADGLIRREGSTLVVVFAIIGDAVRLSARSNISTMSLDEFLRERFGMNNAGAKVTPDGIGEGGARLDFKLESVWVDAPGNREHILQVVLNGICSKVFA